MKVKLIKEILFWVIWAMINIPLIIALVLLKNILVTVFLSYSMGIFTALLVEMYSLNYYEKRRGEREK